MLTISDFLCNSDKLTCLTILEEKLVNIQNNSILSNNTEKMSEEKIAKAKQILKELGYDK